MKMRDKLVLIAISIVLTGVFLLGIVLTGVFFDSPFATFMGVMASFFITCLIMAYTVPIIFKNYIKEFWKREEEKNEQKKTP